MTTFVVLAIAVCVLCACASADEITTASRWARKALLGDTAIDTSAPLSFSLPFSFIYDGKPSTELLSKWKRAQSSADGLEIITYTDPATGLEVTCEAKIFSDYPAVEWVMHFTNKGSSDTPLIENILPINLNIDAVKDANIVFHHSNGSTCSSADFLPHDDEIKPGGNIHLAPNGGRSSNGVFPFFNLQMPDGGIVGAIGWSGQWAMDLNRDSNGKLNLRAGQETTHLKLHPGESIRTPRILLVLWQGKDQMRGHNIFRRLLIDHYVPRRDGKIIMPPVTQNTWFTYDKGNEGNGTTETNQLAAQKVMKSIGVEAYWLDAGWFEGGWPRGAGSWVPRKDNFPNGLKPVGDGAHDKGMDFVLWFEPERVTQISIIAKEHPEWVMHGSGDGLFNLGIPEARQWLTDYLSKCFSDWGVDVFRNDFNIDPLPFWKAADAPDRQGMSEIRYIEGLYTMWDELRSRRPGLWIDNCASGGRRIDLETTMRSIPLWHSDTQCCGRAMPTQDQVQTAGLALYIPLHAAGVWNFDPYAWRSVAFTGTNLCMDITAKDFDRNAAVHCIEELKSLREYYLGDYYPLMDINLDDYQWTAWQFDRPETGRGCALFFRRPLSPYTSAQFTLHGIDPKANYDVTFADSARKRKMTGEELANLQIDIPSAPASVLLTYSKHTGK